MFSPLVHKVAPKVVVSKFAVISETPKTTSLEVLLYHKAAPKFAVSKFAVISEAPKTASLEV